MKQSSLLAVLSLAVASICVGCTTLQSTQLPPDEVRHGIRSGALVRPGDEISVVTTDGREHILILREVDEDTMRGKAPDGAEVALTIDDVLALRTHETEPVRTTFAVLGGGYIALMGVFFVLALMSFA